VSNDLRERWSTAWAAALDVWSRYTRLRSPVLCVTARDAQAEGLTDSFAMIRLQDQAVIVNLQQVAALGLGDYAVEILAHEIGHHVLAPASLSEHARMIARMRWALPTVEQHAALAANLYTDLLINDRLQRSAELRLADVYRTLRTKRDAGSVWALYMRTCEILWSLQRGALNGGRTDDRMEGDALLGSRLVRSYALDWLDGAGRFASLLLPYLLEDQGSRDLLETWADTRNAAAGGDPAGLTGEEEGERDGAIHPAYDPDLTGCGEEEGMDPPSGKVEPREVSDGTRPSAGQARQPFEYGEILRCAGITLSDHDVAVRYYRERARPYLVPFPSRRIPESADPLPEGLEPWDMGESLDAIDWLQTVLNSPRIIPGVTTVQRVWGTTEGRLPQRRPFDMDLYVDSSGSMVNPQHLVSYPALAGAILCLSALRAGARVKATLWSDKRQVTSTAGFIRNEEQILRVLTGYYGGGTAFPLHVLRDTYAPRKEHDRPVHILVISDDGVSTMFDPDEKGNSGWDLASMALRKAGGGGTLVLNMPSDWERLKGYDDAFQTIRRARDEQGWEVFRVAEWDDLVDFARRFSRTRYGDDDSAGPREGES
jgi:hypothetical protein